MNDDIKEAIEWAKTQSLFYAEESDDKLLDNRNSMVSKNLKTLIASAKEAQELLEKYDKLRIATNKIVNWEKSGAFICGVFGKDQDTGLPEGLEICPCYGADISSNMAYWRNDIVKELRVKNEALIEAASKQPERLSILQAMEHGIDPRIANYINERFPNGLQIVKGV